MDQNLGRTRVKEQRNLESPGVRQKGSGFSLTITFMCFLTFGGIMGGTKPAPTPSGIILSMLIALIIAVMLFLLLHLTLKGFNSQGEVSLKIGKAISCGMLFMVPFTIIAAFGFFFLQSNAIIPFASAALTASTGNVGSEVMKAGGKGVKNILVPMILAMFFSTVWIVLTGMVP